jgi:DNA-binding transcriptional ArsR family regulator
MAKTENSNILEIEKKLTTLQDLILKLKVDFDLITRNQVNHDINTNIIDSIKGFLDKRPQECEVLNECTNVVQKGVMKILRVLSEEGLDQANELIEHYFSEYNNYFENGLCHNNSCLESSLTTLTTLKDYINRSDQKSNLKFKDLLRLHSEYELSEGNEERESKLMSVLGNETRIKILKELSKGGSYYTQLERTLGIRGGHFNFHLKELKDAKFIEASETDKSYHITPRGLQALSMIFEISKDY